MQTGSGAKNPPWARSNVNSNMTGMNPQIMDPNTMISQQGIMPFQQSGAVFNPNMMQNQSGMAMPMGGQMGMNQMAQGQIYPGNVVAYPTPRAMNPNMYQNNQNNQTPASTEQRVFTGTVTKTHNDFGFVDHDVFYQTSVCAKGIIPKVNDRVLVEANYNPNMPFKWNASRVQVLPKGGMNQKAQSKSSNYNAVPPPQGNKKNLPPRRDDRPPPMRRDDRKRSRSRSRSRSRDNRRESREIRRRDSPPRKRPVIHQPSPIKYVVRVPRMPLDIQKLDVPSLTQRYTNLYVPSDFFNAHVKWGQTFPPQTPLSLNNPCSFHIMSKEIENPLPNDAVLEPPDADYRFSAKVMLISMPTLESLYQKCGLTKTDDKDKRSSKNAMHPTRLIKFLVGQKGKGGENFAIGGPWSPSLDGPNPDTDPSVLVKTAIRTCKALTGIDLSSCTQWYRMVEFYYWRESSSSGKSRVESVVLFLPDVWSAAASRLDWPTVQARYAAASDRAVANLGQPATPADATMDDKSQIENANESINSTITIDENEDDEKIEPTHYSKIDLKTIKVDQLRQELKARKVSFKGLRAQLISRLSKLLKSEEENEGKTQEVHEVDDEEPEGAEEGAAENKDSKEKDGDKKPEAVKDDSQEEKPQEKKVKTEKEIEEEKKKLEREKQQLKIRYELPSSPHIIVHPNGAAKNGKFGCNTATLSLLLDYRVTDNKEHSFELFVFAELFNEMLMRDFGFYIYKTLYTLPEKVEEVKEKEKSVETEKKDDKKDADKKESDKKDGDKNESDKKDGDKKESDKKDVDKKEEKEKKDDRRDDKRESRKRDRKDSHSDDERSNSPKRKGRGVDLPADPYLLLSLVYFDTSRSCHINKKDLQNLFMSLGLQLSRSQIRSVLEKVCVKDSFNYKSLSQAIKDISAGTSDMLQDLPLDAIVPANVDVPTHIAELESTIATGNRNILPIFDRPSKESGAESDTKDISDSGIVTYKSRVIDIGALIQAEKRNTLQRTKLEETVETLKLKLKEARQAAQNTLQAESSAQSRLQDLNDRLDKAKAKITSLTASSKIFHAALKSIQSKVEAVVNIKYEDDDVSEVANGPTKTEKKEKIEPEVKPDVKSESKSTEDKKASKKEDLTEKNTTTAPNATENMEIDDKE